MKKKASQLEKKAPTRISDFQKKCKLFFSSLSARGCTKLYINLPDREDELILSNADPDALTTFSLQNLIAIHRIRPGKEFMDEFKRLFLANCDLPCPYLIKTEFITKSFKDNRIEEAKSELRNKGELFISSKEIKPNLVEVSEPDAESELDDNEESEGEIDFREEVEKLLEDDGWDTAIKRGIFRNASIAGIPIIDPYVISKLEDCLLEMEEAINMCEKSDIKKISYTVKDLINQSKFYANWYLSPFFYPYQFFPELNPDECLEQNVLMTDGLNCPCLSEFFKKQKLVDDEEHFHLYIYPYMENAVKTIAHFNKDGVDILTARPFFYTVLILTRITEKERYRHAETANEVFHHARQK